MELADKLNEHNLGLCFVNEADIFLIPLERAERMLNRVWDQYFGHIDETIGQWERDDISDTLTTVGEILHNSLKEYSAFAGQLKNQASQKLP